VRLGDYWPAFVAAGVVEVWLVIRIRRWGRFPFPWVMFTIVLGALLTAGLWAESFLATRLAYQTLSENARVDAWGELRGHVARSWPLLVPLAMVLLGLVMRPRSLAAVAALVVAAGVLASWIVAMWLFSTTHSPTLFQLLVLPGGLGIVASLVGFTAATAIWMAIGRWIWREGRRRTTSRQGHRLD
jgi:hypothetical protein